MIVGSVAMKNMDRMRKARANENLHGIWGFSCVFWGLFARELTFWGFMMENRFFGQIEHATKLVFEPYHEIRTNSQ